MLITHEREKLLNAIIFFAEKTRACGKTKLFKLLYLLDFEHFKATGRSVTGLDYFAWKMGPVPVALAEEWDAPSEDLSSAVAIEEQDYFGYALHAVKPRKAFDDSVFSTRELRLLQELADRYAGSRATEMVDVTHAENGAWARIFGSGKGMNKVIPYELAVDAARLDDVLAAAEEFEDLRANYCR